MRLRGKKFWVPMRDKNLRCCASLPLRFSPSFWVVFANFLSSFWQLFLDSHVKWSFEWMKWKRQSRQVHVVKFQKLSNFTFTFTLAAPFLIVPAFVLSVETDARKELSERCQKVVWQHCSVQYSPDIYHLNCYQFGQCILNTLAHSRIIFISRTLTHCVVVF